MPINLTVNCNTENVMAVLVDNVRWGANGYNFGTTHAVAAPNNRSDVQVFIAPHVAGGDQLTYPGQAGFRVDGKLVDVATTAVNAGAATMTVSMP